MKLALSKTNHALSRAFVVLFSLGLAGLLLVSCERRPPQYVSLAKLVASWRPAEKGARASDHAEYLKDFYGTVIETLESPEMHKRAEERVRALNTDIMLSEVEVHVEQTEGTAFFNVAAYGTEPKFTRVFLDSLLDEFRAFRDQVWEQRWQRALTALTEKMPKAEADLKRARDALADFKKLNDVATLQRGEKDSMDLLKDLRANEDRAASHLKAAQEAAKTASAKDPSQIGDELAEQEKEAQRSVTMIEGKITELIENSGEVAKKLAEHERLQRACEASERARQEVLDELSKYQISDPIVSETVTVMERASPAVEDVRPWWQP